MQKVFYVVKYMLVVLLLIPSIAISHSGRTDASGGHYNRKTGEYHYHNGGRSPAVSSTFIESNDPKGQMVYVTRTGKKYHRDGCTHLKSRIPLSLKEAKIRYSPCKVCVPQI